MADTIRYVDTDVVGGLGDGTSLANAYSGILAWNTAEATAVGTGDRHLCYFSGAALDVAGSNVYLGGWSGAGELHLIGDSPDEPFEVDTTAYRLQPYANGSSFVLSNSIDKIVISNFQQVYGANQYTGGAYKWVNGETIGNVDFIHCVVDYTLGTNTDKAMLDIDGTGSVGGKAINRDNCLTIGSAKEDISNPYRQDLTITSTNCTFSGDFTTRLLYSNQTSSPINYTNCAIESSVLMDVGNSPVTYTNCATNTGVGTSPVTIASWSTAFVDKAAGDYTPAGALIGAGTGGLNIGTVESGGAAGDTTPPVITRVGADPATFVSGNAGTYTDAGFTASDDTDGDITANIAITGLPTNFIGAHTVRANVSDAALNPAIEVTRTVYVTVPAGYAFIELSIPDLIDDAKLLYGLTGDPAVTGDQLVAQSPSAEGLAYTLEADGGITWAVAPTVTQTINRYVIKADGTVGTEAAFTYTVAGTSPPVSPANQAVNVTEGNTAVGNTSTATGTAPITYSKGGTDAGSFNVNTTTGALTFITAPDYETKTSYSVTVIANNAYGTDSHIVTVTILNVIEETITAPTPANVGYGYGGAGVPHTDSNLLAWLATASVTGGGAVTNNLAAQVDPLVNATVITFSATDAADQTSTVTPTEAAPTAPIMPATATRNVAQPNQLMGVYKASNNPIPAATYTLTGTDAGLLSINGSTGAVTANSPTSVAGKSSYSFNVVATNIAGTDTTAVTVTIVLVVAKNMTEWIAANGEGGQTNEAWLKYMLGAGASGKTFNDLMFDWLGILGYTGSLTERVAAWSKASLN